MEKNKTGKYLKYAIGEIILVVIGILIALQINNWNEGRKEHKIGIQFLEGINNDINKDIVLIDSLLKLNQQTFSVISSIDSVFHKKPYFFAEENSHLFDEPDTLNFEHVFFRNVSFRPINSTYSSLIADGKTALIKNKPLLDKIQRIYNENHQRVASNYQSLKRLETGFASKYAFEKQNWTYTDLKNAKNQPIFYDLVNFTVEKYWYCLNLIRIKTNSKEVISLINKELAND
jgi:hypothetical protein